MMTDNVLQKLEEKVVLLLAEVESLRKEVKHLNHENSMLRSDREGNSRRVQDLIALLESVNAEDGLSAGLSLVASEKSLAV